jgi:hypothetical protein
MPPSLNDRTYIAKRDALKRKTRTNDLPCWLCGETNWDWDNWKAQLAFTADYVEPRGNGGHLLGELKPAHRSCNSSRSNRVTTVKTQPSTTKQW